ncbi:helix-turn-helix domain-containing protein [Amycolatopsis orientalis]|uniref:helix-turn-helix domain-containing protein n=1 Tax=Amycolatopsis orientalis TaxID=31958 RepID=UPI000A914B43|nr:helix-turn-helix transcriptional regulator [Amycolatopsis orientalis]
MSDVGSRLTGRETLVGEDEWGGPNDPTVAYAPGLPKITASQHGPADSARRRAVRGLTLSNRGANRQQTVALAQEALEMSDNQDVVCLWSAVITLIQAEELQLAERQVEARAVTAGRQRTQPHQAALTLLRARILALTGQTVEARRILTGMLAAGQRGHLAEVCVAWLVEIMADLGDIEQAKLTLKNQGYFEPGKVVTDYSLVLAAMAALEFAAGCFGRSLDDFLACGKLLTNMAVFNPSAIRWRSPASLCSAALGYRNLALCLAQDELEVAKAWGGEYSHGVALHALAIAQSDNRTSRGLRVATTLLARSPIRHGQVRVHYDFGTHLAECHRPAEARKMFDAARRMAELHASPVWSARAADAADRMLELTPGSALTREEISVASLARSGLTNREISQRSNITVSTVEQHLCKVFDKLDVANRKDLAYAMLNPKRRRAHLKASQRRLPRESLALHAPSLRSKVAAANEHAKPSVRGLQTELIGLERLFGYHTADHRGVDGLCSAARAAQLLASGESRLEAAARAESALKDEGCLEYEACVFYSLLTLICADKPAVAGFYAARVSSHSDGRDSSSLMQMVAVLRARIQHLTGAKSAALDNFATIVPNLPVCTLSSTATAWWAEALVDAHRPQDAARILAIRDGETSRTLLPGGDRTLLLVAQAATKAALGNPAAGIDDYLQCGKELRRYGLTNPAIASWQSGIALATPHRRDRDQAGMLAMAGLTAARRWGSAAAVGRALYVSAVTCCTGETTDVVKEILGLLRASESRNELLRTIVPLGLLLTEQGHSTAARNMYCEAIRLSAEYRDVHVANLARAALQDISSPRRLTTQEFRVARLAAAGFGNDIVASSLSLSRRTVETHLSTTYRKLGLSGRRELVGSMPSSFDHRGQLWS